MGSFVGEKNLDVIKMHGTTIKKIIKKVVYPCSAYWNLFQEGNS
jgi:hypothetical protein